VRIFVTPNFALALWSQDFNGLTRYKNAFCNFDLLLYCLNLAKSNTFAHNGMTAASIRDTWRVNRLRFLFWNHTCSPKWSMNFIKELFK
jgi:hypothetical protein